MAATSLDACRQPRAPAGKVRRDIIRGNRFAPGSLLEGVHCRIAFHRYCSATVASMQRHRGIHRKLEAELPQSIALSAGGNDINSAGPDAPHTYGSL